MIFYISALSSLVTCMVCGRNAKNVANKLVFWEKKLATVTKEINEVATVPGLATSDHIWIMYAAPVWNPHQQGLINSLERVQKFALKVCNKNWSSGYEWVFASVMQPTHAPLPAEDTTWNCAYSIKSSKFPIALILPWNQSRSLINSSTLALERPLHTRMFINRHIQLPFGTAYLSLPMQNCESLFSNGANFQMLAPYSKIKYAKI